MLKRADYIFSSESVSEGHPDKVCDQISDAVLDDALSQDKNSRVACEVYATTGLVVVGGEITTNAFIETEQIVRKVLKDIGYNNPEFGIDYRNCGVISVIKPQSPDIAMGVDSSTQHEQGAGDQGIMFGFACSDTPELMPAPITYSHALMHYASKVRKDNTLPYLRPDAKCQVTLRYENHKPVAIDTVVFSQQHHPDVPIEQIRHDITESIIKKVLPSHLLHDKTCYLINPTGRFVIGGPQGDVGLTGRKIIVDTYGGFAPHGGGAFSGKDPSKVDRSAAYLARYMAKHVVAAGLASSCEIQLAYAIGIAQPVSLYVNTYGTINDKNLTDAQLEKALAKVFPLKPAEVIEDLQLKSPFYRPTASYGHFGRNEFTWEQLDRIDLLLKAL
jgi:S-adenosylmethionine synthetase